MFSQSLLPPTIAFVLACTLSLNPIFTWQFHSECSRVGFVFPLWLKNNSPTQTFHLCYAQAIHPQHCMQISAPITRPHSLWDIHFLVLQQWKWIKHCWSHTFMIQYNHKCIASAMFYAWCFYVCTSFILYSIAAHAKLCSVVIYAWIWWPSMYEECRGSCCTSAFNLVAYGKVLCQILSLHELNQA